MACIRGLSNPHKLNQIDYFLSLLFVFLFVSCYFMKHINGSCKMYSMEEVNICLCIMTWMSRFKISVTTL